MKRVGRVLAIAVTIGVIAGCDSPGSRSGADAGDSSGSSSGNSSGSSGGGSGSSSGAGSGCESGACTVVTAIATGGLQTCALLSGGTVECWGDNTYGQLGDGTTTGPATCADTTLCSTTPVAVSGLSDATAIAAGNGHVCVLLSGGTLECWGGNETGELGIGTALGPQSCDGAGKLTACSTTPVAVPGLSGATALAAGAFHTCVLLSGGTVECWGNNSYGQLGDGTATGRTAPVAVSGLSGVTAIAAGFEHTCALLSGGTVECWGNNYDGQLGNGMSAGPETCFADACSMAPVAVSGLSGVTAISAGGHETCALLSDGTVECWGANINGELGDGTSTGPQSCSGESCSTTPVVVTGLSGVTAISTGDAQSCALLSGGTIECWGDNDRGELGDGTTTSRTTPVAVSGLTAATGVYAGADSQTCALLSGGAVQCWGYNEEGTLGDGWSGGPELCSGYGCSTIPVEVSGL